MPLPVEADSIGRAAQAILCWADRDCVSLCWLLAKIDTLDEAKDIIVAMAMLISLDPDEIQGIALKTSLG